MLSQQTATDMAVIYRDIEAAEKLLADVRSAIDKMREVDIRDVFGRRHHALQLGIPSGENAHRIQHVPYDLATPVIEATIASHRVRLKALNEKAKIEVLSDDPPTADAGE